MTVAHDADEILVGFTRALAAAGVPVTADRTHAYLEAVALVGLDDASATYAAGRATLCGGPDDLDRYDRVFHEWFGGDLASPDRSTRARQPVPGMIDLAEGGPSGEGDVDDVVRAAASAEEVLRHRDVASLSLAERQRLNALFASFVVRPPRRRAARRQRARRGTVDTSRTLRASLRRMGEPAQIHRRRRGTRARRVVLLLDISGSMSAYADALLRLAHRVTASSTSGDVEVFSVGTRLTHLTRALRQRDADRAIVAAGQVVPDWSGGTRLGETLRVFVDRHRDRARGAVVVVFSDGWERGDPALLAEQVARLHRLAHRVVWVNPHRGKEGYEPVQVGVVAVLPHVDDFLAGHSLATYAELTEVIARA